MKLATHAVLIACLAAAAASNAAAGVVEVSFTHPDRFADAGRTAWDRQPQLDALASHLQALGKRLLPADQVLKVEVLDVDLAGQLRPTRTGRELRFIHGGADWPRVTLRYSLQSGDKALQRGEERVADMNYAFGFNTSHSADPLHYEKRMLETWFKARFVEPRAD